MPDRRDDASDALPDPPGLPPRRGESGRAATVPPPPESESVDDVEEPGESETRAHDGGVFPCAKCGADLRFRPAMQTLRCDYCAHVNAIPQSEDEIEELDFREWIAKASDDSGTEDVVVLSCGTCGAQPEVDAGVTSLECPFCGSAIVRQGESKRLIKPWGVLPFIVERRDGRTLFRKWLKGLWFAPSSLKRGASIETKLHGVYLPYWTFDSKTVTVYRGKRGTVRTRGYGKNRRTYTSWRSVSGTVLHAFDDVLVRGSRSVPEKLADELEPWDLGSMKPYEDAYLAGFRAEAYAIDLREGFGRATSLMDGVLRAKVERDIGGDRQRITSMKTEHRGVTFKHILLPIWISAYRYNGKSYRFLINGRTGEVQGERPWSWVKISAAVLAGLAVVGIAFWVINGSGWVSHG